MQKIFTGIALFSLVVAADVYAEDAGKDNPNYQGLAEGQEESDVALKETAVTLEEALVRSYHGSNVLQGAEASIQAAQERNAQSNRSWLPTLGMSVTGQMDFANKKGFYRPLDVKTDINTKTQANKAGATLDISHELYSGGATLAGGRRTAHLVHAAEAERDNLEGGSFATVVTVYLGVCEARTILENAKHNVRFFEQQVRAAEAKFEAGVIDISEVEALRAKLEAARASLVEQQAKTAIAESAYVKEVGEFPSYKLVIPELPKDIPQSDADVVKITLANNNQIQAADATTKSFEEEVEIAKAGLLPKLTVSASLSRTLASDIGTNSDSFYNRSRTNDATIGATIKIPLDYSGLTQAQVREKKYAVAQAKLKAVQLRRDQVNQALGYWQQFKAAEAQIKLYEAQIKAATVALNVIEESFRVGNKTYIDVIQAKQLELEAQNGLVTSQKNRIVALYNLFSTFGTLGFKAQGLKVDTRPASTEDEVVGHLWGTGVDEYPALHLEKDPAVAAYEAI